MKAIKTMTLAIAAICSTVALSVPINAPYDPIEPSTGDVVPGEWNDSISAGQAYADAHNIPMLAIYGTHDCANCRLLQTACNTDTFKEWAARKNIVMVFSTTAAAMNFCRPPNSSFKRFVCVYWKKVSGETVKVSFTGASGALPSTEGATLAEQLINSCDLYIGAYPKMTGYEHLAFTNSYANARLEAVAGETRYVDVPLVREAFMKGVASTNSLKAVFKGQTVADETVVWAASSLETAVRVEIPDDAVPGDEISVTFTSASGEESESVTVFVVEPKGISTKNPLFVGERTAQTLGYGEWTMDLDVAMEKYAAEPEARLMAIASGSLWCPDCVMTDSHVLENPAFEEWAQENKVILVDIDVPNFPNTTNSACLLTYATGRTSDGYVSGRGTLATNELERFQSGAGYLSRHMATASAAKAVLERNRSLVGRNTLEGGWNNPDRTNQNRTGIPNFFALRRDGSLAGAFETFDAIGPSEFKEAYLKRFSELVAMGEGEDDGDFSNRSWQTTEDPFSGEGALSGDLAPLDLADTYALAAITTEAAVQTVTAQGGEATATLSIIAVTGGEASTVATATGPLTGGISVSCTMTPKETYYVKLAGAAEGALAADSDAAFGTVGYTLRGERSPIANPYENEWTQKAAKAVLPLYAADGSGLAGRLELQLKKNGKISAKVSDSSRRLASLSGTWNADISADGTATAVLEKGGWTLELSITASGAVSASLSGAKELASGECALAESYADWTGNYAVALPLSDASGAWLGNAYMTLSIGGDKASVTRGKVKYKVFLPDGKKLSGTTGVTGRDADFGVVPVAKTSGANTFRASVLVRRNAASAPTRRAVVADGDAAAVWSGDGVELRCGVFGSLVSAGDSLLERADAESLAFVPDASGIGEDGKYGTLNGVLYDGGLFAVTAQTIYPVEKVSGFAFKLNRKTGVFTGKTKLSFSGKDKVSAKYSGVILPDWFSDCECQEDADTVVPMTFQPFGAGQCIYSGVFGGKRVKRSFPVSLGVKPME